VGVGTLNVWVDVSSCSCSPGLYMVLVTVEHYTILALLNRQKKLLYVSLIVVQANLYS